MGQRGWCKRDASAKVRVFECLGEIRVPNFHPGFRTLQVIPPPGRSLQNTLYKEGCGGPGWVRNILILHGAAWTARADSSYVAHHGRENHAPYRGFLSVVSGCCHPGAPG